MTEEAFVGPTTKTKKGKLRVTSDACSSLINFSSITQQAQTKARSPRHQRL